MKKLIIFIVVMIFIPKLLFANPSQWEITKIVTPSRTPYYFFRVIPGKSYISYTNGTSNVLINTTNNKEKYISGQVDAIPDPDGYFLSVPSLVPTGLSFKLKTMRFFSIDRLTAGDSRYKSRILTDRKMPGAYQTIAILNRKKTSDGMTLLYKIVSESFFTKTKLFVKKYRVDIDNNGKVKSMKALSKLPGKFCPQLTISLPILSKSGKYFAAVDPDTRNMKIYTINSDETCSLFDDLEMPTGKVDFSYDDKKMAFHVSSINPKEIAYVVKEQSKIRAKLNVFIYDLESKTMEAVTRCEKANCYYPSFQKDGTLAFMKQYKDSDKYEFVFVEKKE